MRRGPQEGVEAVHARREEGKSHKNTKSCKAIVAVNGSACREDEDTTSKV